MGIGLGGVGGSTSGSSGSGLFQFNGVISGLNTSAIIQAMLTQYTQPISLLQTQSSQLTSQQSAINQISTDTSALQTAIQALTLASNVAAKTATTNTPAGSPAVVTATAGSGAANGSFQVTVKQLATATSVTSASPDGGTTAAAIAAAVNLTAPLASAGLGTAITTGTFTINGKTITIDGNTALDNPSNPTESIVDEINNSGAGVTASIVDDAYGRPNEIRLISNSGQPIQLGNNSDTSNFLAAVGLSSGAIVGNTASTVTGIPVAAGVIDATMIVDGKTVNLNQTNSGNTGAQNAAYIVSQLNAAGLDVTASVTGTGNDQIQLTQNTKGSQQVIDITVSGTNASAVGLTNGTYQNGTDSVTTTTPLGETNPTASISSVSFATPLAPVSGGGTISINGTQINWSTSDSLNNILSKINSSSAGVLASYDPLTDRVTLSANQTGGGAINLQDVSGNLLESLHLMTNATTSVPQQLGKNSIVDISTVNNGQDIVSSSNNLNGIVPGVNLTLNSTSATPVTVTVGQDTTTTTNAVQGFVNAANTLFGDIDKLTAETGNAATAGVLAGDTGIQSIEDTLKTMIASPVTGGTPGYNTLASVGITTGAIGSAPGTTNQLQLDTATLDAALQANPNAVQNLFAGLNGTLGAVTQTSGTGNFVSGASGLPTNSHTNGTYVVTVDGSGNATAEFDQADGQVLFNSSATLSANGTNNTLIPGVTLTTGATVQAGTFQIPVTWNQVGAAVSLNDYLNSLTNPTTGFFANRNQSITSEQTDISSQISDLQNQMSVAQQGLQQEYSQLEVTLSQLQMQSGALSAQAAALASMSSSGTGSSGSSSSSTGH